MGQWSAKKVLMRLYLTAYAAAMTQWWAFTEMVRLQEKLEHRHRRALQAAAAAHRDEMASTRAQQERSKTLIQRQRELEDAKSAAYNELLRVNAIQRLVRMADVSAKTACGIAFRRWSSAAQYERYHAESMAVASTLMGRVVRRMQRARLAKGFHKWIAVARRATQSRHDKAIAAQQVGRALARMQKAACVAGWNSWRSKVQAAQQRQADQEAAMQMLERVMLRMQKVKLTAGWSTWHQNTIKAAMAEQAVFLEEAENLAVEHARESQGYADQAYQAGIRAEEQRKTDLAERDHQLALNTVWWVDIASRFISIDLKVGRR